MKTTIDYNGQEIKLTSEYIGDTKWKNSKLQNYNNHVITVEIGDDEIEFDFWGSMVSPEISSEGELRFAFSCFLSDANAGDMSYEEFIGEFGYEDDVTEIHDACKVSSEKCEQLGIDHVEVYNFLLDNYEEDM